MATLVVADFYHMVPLSRTPFLFALGWLSLRARGLKWRDVGFTRPDGWMRALAVGCLAGVCMEVFSTFVSVPFFSRLAGRPPDLSDFQPLVGNLELVIILMVPMWLMAAFGEEMVFRGYLMNRVAGIGRKTPPAWLGSLIVVSAFFGSSHEAQGLTGMVQEGLAGLILGLLYLGSRRNLAVPIIAHGISNTLAFVLIYLDRYPGV